jgi:hypothetical protein
MMGRPQKVKQARRPAVRIYLSLLSGKKAQVGSSSGFGFMLFSLSVSFIRSCIL